MIQTKIDSTKKFIKRHAPEIALGATALTASAVVYRALTKPIVIDDIEMVGDGKDVFLTMDGDFYRDLAANASIVLKRGDEIFEILYTNPNR